MKIIVLGAGQVGSTVAASLAAEDNDVTIVDTDADKLAEMGNHMDLQTVVGSASYPLVLRKAGAEDADMIIAATDSDEVNIVAIQVAYSLFSTPAKIARIRSTEYLREVGLFTNKHIPIDLPISPEELVTEYIQRVIEHPGALQVVDFAEGRVRLVGVQVLNGAPMVGRCLADLKSLLGGIESRVTAIYRDRHGHESEAIIPEGDTVINSGDIVFFLGERKHTTRVMAQFHQNERPCKRITIAGGGNIGLLLARKLERHYRVTVVETRAGRARFLAETLISAMVLEGDAANQQMLKDEGIADTDVFCALTNDDEANILSAMLAKNNGARKIMSLINRPEYVDLVERNIIDVAISPQQITIGALLTHIRRGDVVAVHSLRKGEAEALEGVAHGDAETSALVGKAIGKVKLPKGAIVGAVVRGDEVHMAHHDLIIEDEDHLVVLVVNKAQIADVEKLFEVGYSVV